MLRTGLATIQWRQMALTPDLSRRGRGGSKTHFYSSLGNNNYLKKRTSRNRFRVDPIENVVELQSGSRRFKPSMVDAYNDRPESSLPVSRLPMETRFAWHANLSEETEKTLLEAELKSATSTSIMRDERWPLFKYQAGSRRTGLIMKKIGVETMWWKDGRKLNATMFQIQNCHVIKYFPRHEHNGRDACLIVGAGLGNPFLKNENYIDYCHQAGVAPKARLARFPITENAALEPGTALQVQHFHVGQHVDIVQRSVDYGITDIVTRFHKKALSKHHYHARKVGSIAGAGSTKQDSSGNWFNELSGRPLKGRRMPGQLGGVDTTAWQRRILRMNTKFQIIWVLGHTPGHVGEYGRVYDTRTTKDQAALAKDAPMFPTYYPELHGTDWTDEIWDADVHCWDDANLTF